MGKKSKEALAASLQKAAKKKAKDRKRKKR
jgi:hypothetical protein